MNTSDLTEYAASYAPWRRGIAWWIVLIQALIALAVGIYALLNPASAAWIIITGFCVYFIGAALRTIWQALRGQDIGFSVLGLLAAGGGFTMSVAVLIPVLRAWFGNIEVAPGMQNVLMYVFGSGMFLIGLLSIGSAFVERPEHGVRWASVIRGAIFLILGAYVLIELRRLAPEEDPLLILVLSWGFVVIGVLLCIQTYVLYRGSRPPAEATPPKAAPPAPSA